MKRYIALFFVALAGGLLAIAGWKLVEKNQPRYVLQNTIPVTRTGSTAIPANVPDFVDAASISVHAVVHISAEWQTKNAYYDSFFDNFFNPGGLGRQRGPVIGTGSGVIISPDGYIVTNNHVVQDASKLEVTLNDKRVYTASVVGTDPSTDLAVIKIDAKELPALVYGNSDDVKVGEWVLAVGNPFNLASTVTAGIVSAKARNINILENGSAGGSIESFIQTDAAVNRGNSGGALVNATGQLIGINAAIASGNGFYTGYSFAIPVNIVKKVVADLIQYGAVQRAYLGVQIREVDANLAEEKGYSRVNGVYVSGMMDNSAAEKAGMKTGDVIIAVNNFPVSGTSELLEQIATYSPGDKVNVTIERNGDTKNLSVTLMNEQGTKALVKKDDTFLIDQLGASFKPIDASKAKKLGLKQGVEVTQIRQGALASIGIKEGFIITRIDRTIVSSSVDIAKALKDVRGGVLIEGVYPNGVRAYYGLGL